MQDKRAHGVIPALVTPFTKSGEVDIAGLQNLVAYVVEGGVHGVFANSSTGEYNNIGKREQRTVVEVVHDMVQDLIPVFVNASALSVRDGIENGKKVADWGADFAVYTPPFYYKYSQAELVKFFTLIADEVPVPVMIYNHVSLKNVLELPAILELADHPNIVGLKDTTVNMRGFLSTVTALQDKPGFSLFQGTEGLFSPSVVFGGHGGVLALACVAPKLFCAIYEARQDPKQCLALELKVQRLLQILSIAGDYGQSINNFLMSIHTALAALDICRAKPSQLADELPNESNIAKVNKILVDVGVLE